MVSDVAFLADELIQPLAGDGPVAVGIGIHTVIGAGRFAVDGDAEAHRLAVAAGPQHQMQVAGVEAIDDTAAGRIQRGALVGDGPVAGQAPGIQFVDAGLIGVAHVAHRAAGRDEILGARVAEISLRRLDLIHVRGGLGARRADVDEVGGFQLVAGLRQQQLNDALGFVVVAFAEMMVADTAFGIDEVMRRPVVVIERAPDLVVVVDGHRIIDLEIGHCLLDVTDDLLEGEFRRVHADYHKTLVLVFVGPCADVRQRAQAIDAGIGPEIDQHHLALERLARQRRRVQPFHRAVERGHGALHRQHVGHRVRLGAGVF